MARVRTTFDRTGSHRRRRHGSGRAGFTMLEILIVIGVLVVLATIVLMGMRQITGKAKGEETRLSLQNLRGMLAEFDNVTRLGKGPQMWGFINDGGNRVTVRAGDTLYPDPVTPGENVTADFWRAPFKSGREAPAAGTDSVAPMDATGSVHDVSSTMRNGARQLMFTQLAMNYIYSVPANRSAMQAMRADRLWAPEWANLPMTGPGPDGVLGTTDDVPATGGERVHYYPGCRVTHDKKIWRCVTEHPANTPPTQGTWQQEGQEVAPAPRSLPAPILLDGWNNPILLVPATGLRVRMLNGESALDPMKAGQTVVVVSPDGSVKPPVMPGTPGKLVRPGKPFFVSAGPDGDYSTGDDNLYSFEE